MDVRRRELTHATYPIIQHPRKVIRPRHPIGSRIRVTHLPPVEISVHLFQDGRQSKTCKQCTLTRQVQRMSSSSSRCHRESDCTPIVVIPVTDALACRSMPLPY